MAPRAVPPCKGTGIKGADGWAGRKGIVDPSTGSAGPECGVPITVKIGNDDNRPLAGVTVAITGKDTGGNPQSFSPVTAGNGQLSKTVPNGSYKITPQGPGQPSGGKFYTMTCSGKAAKFSCATPANEQTKGGAAFFRYLTKAKISGKVTDDADPMHKLPVDVLISGTDHNGKTVKKTVHPGASGAYSATVKPGSYKVTAKRPETEAKPPAKGKLPGFDFQAGNCTGIVARLSCSVVLGPPDRRFVAADRPFTAATAAFNHGSDPTLKVTVKATPGKKELTQDNKGNDKPFDVKVMVTVKNTGKADATHVKLPSKLEIGPAPAKDDPPIP